MTCLTTAAPLNRPSLITRAVNLFTGKRIHLAAFVHNIRYGSNIFSKLPDAILDPWGMCERHVSNSRCTEETGWTQRCEELQRVPGAPNLIHLCLVSMFVSFTYGWMLTCERALSPLAVIAAEVLLDWRFQLKEVLLHSSPDGSLDDSGNHKKHTDVWVQSGNSVNIKPWIYLCFQVFFEAFNFVKVLSSCMIAVCVWICVTHCGTMEAVFLSLEWV